jgi:para-nitrobenzyl esterase
VRQSFGEHPVADRIVADVTMTSPTPLAAGQHTDPDLVREVEGGLLRGLDRGDLLSWRGIPYAAPPVADLRFRSPAPVHPWHGVWDATRFGSVSYQDRLSYLGKAFMFSARSEDCLTLNVTTPAEPAAEPRPVMVFIHGGAYTTGSSRDIPGQGDVLVREGGVVFVNFNYRLGALGYLDFTRYSSPDRPLESNLGLRDQVAALCWVRDNIAAFGGDPDNVTVFGESAGGNAVTTLLATPAAEGLFARAIAQSPPPEAIYTSEVAAGWAEDYVGILRQVTGDAESDPATLLDAATAEELVRAGVTLQRRTPDAVPGTIAFSPIIDGDYLPERPSEAVARGHAHAVPLIIGTNKHEGSLFRGRLDLLASTKPRIRAVFAKTERQARARLFAHYRALPPRGSAAQFAGDYTFWYPSVKYAEGHATHAPVHFYRFDLAPRALNLVGLGATHGIDLFAVFDLGATPVGRLAGLLGGRAAFLAAGARLRSRWLSFARSGDVGQRWPEYDSEHRATLIFGEHDRVEDDPHGDRRDVWQAFVPHL